MKPLPPTHSRAARAFTLLELLVVLAIIAILAGLLFPVFGKARAGADNTQCVSNLRQIGAGIAGYLNDNDNTFPGPCWYGQSPWYNVYDDGSMPGYLEKYLGLKKNAEWNQRANVFVCSAYERAVTVRDAPVYISLDIGWDPAKSQALRPWGDPAPGRPLQPMKMSAIASITDKTDQPITAASVVAIRDVDQSDYVGAKPGWFDKLPKAPVHGEHQNALFYDWHVARLPIVFQENNSSGQ